MSRAPLLIFCVLTIWKHLLKMRFERSGRGQEPSRGHKFSILENVLSIRDFTSAMRLHFRSDLVGVALVGATPLHLLSQTALPLKSPTGAFIARCASQTRSNPKPCSCNGVTVCSERSSYPCFAAALSGSPTESVRSWHSITFRRLMKDSRYGMKKAGRSADTTSYFFQAQEQHFEVVRSTTENKFWKIVQLHKILFVKKKNTVHAA